MTISCECLSCGAKINARDDKAGMTVSCPKCSEPVKIPGARGIVPISRPEVVSRPPESEFEVPAGPIFINVESPAPTRVYLSPSKDPGWAHSLGLGSVILGVVALAGSIVPFLGMLTLPVSGIGIALGLVGLLTSILRSGRGIGFPIAGCTLNGLAIVFGLFWLTAGKAALQSIDEAVSNKVKLSEVKTTPITSRTTDDKRNQNKTPPVELWVDAKQNGISEGGVLIQITEVKIGKVPLSRLGDDSESEEELLMIHLNLTNTTETKRITYTSYDRDDAFNENRVSLKDEFGNVCRGVTFGFTTSPKGQQQLVDIDPGQTVEDVLVFNTPIEKAKKLRLQLPANKFQGTGFLRFEIPISMVKR